MKALVKVAIVALGMFFGSVSVDAAKADTAKVEAVAQGDSAAQSVADETDQVKIERIRADKEVAIYEAKQIHGKGKEPFVAFVVIGVPVISVFVFLIFGLINRRKKEEAANSTLIELAKNGQQITPELVQAMRANPEKSKKDNVKAVSYQTLFVGVALIISGVIAYFLFERHIGMFMGFAGLFATANGLASYFAHKDNKKNSCELVDTDEQH